MKHPRMNYLVIIKTVLCTLFSSVLVSCSQADKRCYSFAESWNSKCPVSLVNDEVVLTGVRYSKGEFVLFISVNDNAPASVLSLQRLNEEYAKRIQEISDYDQNGKEIGGASFIKGVIFKSSAIAQLIDSIAYLTYTPESTQGWVPLNIRICDETDTLSYNYNEEWERLTEYEWLNAVMPVEMCEWTSEGNPLPPLNEVVKVTGIPRISKEGVLNIYCSYDADPAYTRSGKPVCIDDIISTYFSKRILKVYLADRMAESNDVRRYLNACKRRNISIQFIVDGLKDEIDYDLATPEFTKRWESWGGSDSIIVEYPTAPL